MSKAGVFILGALAGIVIIVPVGGYLLAQFGGIAMATTAKPLPGEEMFAHAALHGSMGNASSLQDPLPMNEANMTEGAHTYVENCAVCHGLPGQTKTRIAQGEFPPPPQLFEPKEMVTDDPEGTTFWKVSHGIRLSGMPGFADTLSDTQKWQVSMMLAHADKLPAETTDVLTSAGKENNSLTTQRR